MDEKSKYYHIKDSKDTFMLDDRLELNWKEIILYPTSLFLFLFLGTGHFIPTFIITIIIAILYIVFRFFAWFIYKEIIINKKDRKLFIQNKFLSRIQSTVQIDMKFDTQKFSFLEQTRSGRTKYILQYTTHKTFDLIIIKNEEQKMRIEKQLTKLTSIN